MNKQQLQNLKKYIENKIAGYLKISNDIQNLQFNNDDYLNYFESFTKEDIYKGECYWLSFDARSVSSDISGIIEKLKQSLTKVNEALWQIHCQELKLIMQDCF
jgi:hypothetical protein